MRIEMGIELFRIKFKFLNNETNFNIILLLIIIIM